MGPTPGSSIQGVGRSDSNRRSLLMDWGMDFEVYLAESKLAVCFIDYLVDVWDPGDVV